MTPRLLATVSLLANIALALLIWRGGSSVTATSPAPASASPVVPPVAVVQTIAPHPIVATEEPGPEPWPPFRWAEIASDDYTNYVANLRRIGCPEETIGHIVRGATWTELMRRIHAGAFEQHDLIYHVLADGQKGLKRLEEAFKPVEQAEKERERLLEALFGPATDALPDDLDGAESRRRVDRSFPYVDPERQALLARIEEEWNQKETTAFTNAPSGRERSRIRLDLKEAKRTAQLEVLSAPERAEFERREWPAKNLSRFRTLYAVAVSPEELQSLVALSTEELALKLGPQRMADLKRISEVQEPRSDGAAPAGTAAPKPYLTIHGSFQDLEKVARRFDLPPSVPRAALDVLRSYETPLKTVRDDPDLLPRTRRELIRGLEAERDRQMASIFGREAWETYRFHHGDW